MVHYLSIIRFASVSDALK